MDKRPTGGNRPEDLPNPTRQQLIRHAESYGTAGVHEVAAALLNEKDAARLKIELDRIDAEAPRRRFEKKPAKRRRSTAETQAAAVVLIEDGLNPQAVANR